MENNVCNHNSVEKKKCEMWEKRTSMERYLILIIILIFIILIIFVALFFHVQSKQKRQEMICLTPICKEEAGRILQLIDSSVDPCENFYDFACGKYMKYRKMYSDSVDHFSDLNGYIDYLSKGLLEKPEEENEPEFVKMVKRYYQSCMKEGKVSLKENFETLLNDSQIHEWPLSTHRDFTLEELEAKISVFGKGLLFEFLPSYKDGYLQHVMIYSGDSSITNYLEGNITDEETLKELKTSYFLMFHYVLTKLNLKEIVTEDIINLDISLSQIIKRNREENSTELTIKELEKECPQFKWASFFKYYYQYMDHADNYSDSIPLKVYNMEYVREVCEFLKENEDGRSRTALYNLLIWEHVVKNLFDLDQVVTSLIRAMPKSTRSEISLSSKKDNASRRNSMKWETCINELPMIILFFIQYMLLKSDCRVNEKVQNVETYVKAILNTAEETFIKQNWLDNVSRNYSRFKIKNMKYEVGFSKYSVDEVKLNNMTDKMNITDNYLHNILQTNKFETIEFFFNETFREIFSMSRLLIPYTANAYFTEEKGTEFILLPIGLFHPPFYSPGVPNYLNYATIGTVIGHEIFHGFDSLDKKEENETKKSDSEIGLKIDWPEDFLEEYKRRKECLIVQYSKFPLTENKTLNGTTTIGDNIADVEGLIHGFKAYEKYTKKHGEEPRLPGLEFTNKEMFFIKFAQMECEKTDFRMENYYSHSPGKYRVLGPLMNFPEFSKTFNCPSNSYMNPEHKCILFE